jgi:peptide-methionine (S)-S-oxide reductase
LTVLALRPNTRGRAGGAWAAIALLATLSLGSPARAVQPESIDLAGPPEPGKTAIATFAGGCFWCMEPPFDAIDGVLSTTSGYIGGHEENPTYERVSAGVTGHAEAVQIVYDPAKVSYETLLEVFWRNVDPTTRDRQFCDVGSQYRTAIFFHDDAQKRAAEESRRKLAASGDLGSAEIVTEIAKAGDFYAAEDYHQDYSVRNPVRYKYYRWSCGRDQRLAELWGDKGPANH